jgi:hypothetical protein
MRAFGCAVLIVGGALVLGTAGPAGGPQRRVAAVEWGVSLRLRGGGPADRLPDLPAISDEATEQDKQDYAEAKQWVKRQMAELEELKKQRELEMQAEEDGVDLNTTETRHVNTSIVGVSAAARELVPAADCVAGSLSTDNDWYFRMPPTTARS